MSINIRAGRPPRTPRPQLSVAMNEQIKRRIAGMCGDMALLAVEARVLFEVDGVQYLAEAEAGAAEGDVMRLRRIPRQGGGR